MPGLRVEQKHLDRLIMPSDSRASFERATAFAPHDSTSRGARAPGFLLTCWLIYLVASPFYLFDSGLPQPADVFMAVVMLLLLTGFFAPIPVHRSLYLVASTFLALVAVVNWFWWTQYQQPKFILSSVFYLYNFAIVVVVMTLARGVGTRFFTVTRAGLIAAVVLELVVVAFLPEIRGIRNTGTFNNPNQLGYWSLLMGACLLSVKNSPSSGTRDAGIGELDVAVLCALAYIAGESLSKATIVSFLVLFALGLYFQGAGRRVKMILGVLVVVGGVAMLTSAASVEEWLSEGWSGKIVDRLDDIGKQDDDSAEGRGYDRIWEHPEYLLYGAGEGGPERFTSPAKEIHSTFATVLFSYGFVGFALFLIMLWMIFRHAERRHLMYFLPICTYGLTHQGLRFSLLWVFLGLVMARATYDARVEQSVASRPGMAPGGRAFPATDHSATVAQSSRGN